MKRISILIAAAAASASPADPIRSQFEPSVYCKSDRALLSREQENTCAIRDIESGKSKTRWKSVRGARGESYKIDLHSLSPRGDNTVFANVYIGRSNAPSALASFFFFCDLQSFAANGGQVVYAQDGSPGDRLLKIACERS